MTDTEVLRLLGTSGIAGALLLILARIVYRVGDRMIAALDKTGEAIVGLRQDVAVLGARIEEWSDRHAVPPPPPPHPPAASMPAAHERGRPR